MYKQMFVAPFRGYYSVDFKSTNDPIAYGEKVRGIFDRTTYRINFPASAAEVEMYERELEYRQGPVRVRYHKETRIGSIDDPEFVAVTIPEYRPNRHQKKHYAIWKWIWEMEEGH